MAVTYRNTNTGDVVHLADRDPRLDALHNWQLVDGEVPARVLQALELAAAERRIIEDAGRARLERAKEKADAAVAAATALETPADAGALVPAAAHYTVSVAPPAQILVPSIPPRPGKPSTPEELQAQAEWDRVNPPRTSVLQRARADQRAGRTQIGENPEQHPVGRAALEAQAAYDSENPPAGGVLERVNVDDQGDEQAAAPKRNGTRAEWVTHAVEVHGADAEAAEAMTRDQLIEQYGSN